MGAPLWLFFISLGLAKGQAPNLAPTRGDVELPLCNIDAFIPCMTGAVTSYIRNTKGEAAARLPPDPASMQTVAQAISTNIADPRADLNGTCRIINLVDVDELLECLLTNTKNCTTDVPEEDAETVFKDTLPSMRYSALPDTIDAIKKLCVPACLLGNFKGRISAMKVCWRNSETEVAAAMEGSSPLNCQMLAEYMQCQWSNSIGCRFLEKLSRMHLSSLEDTINKCQIYLPPEAVKEPNIITNSGSPRSSVMLQTAAVLMYTMMCHVGLSLTVIK